MRGSVEGLKNPGTSNRQNGRSAPASAATQITEISAFLANRRGTSKWT